jgi:hypothetical protein
MLGREREAPILAEELRQMRAYVLINAIVAVYGRLAIMIYQHWHAIVENVRYTIFG